MHSFTYIDLLDFLPMTKIWFVLEFQLDWFSARNLCLSEDASIVTLETSGESAAVQNALSN